MRLQVPPTRVCFRNFCWDIKGHAQHPCVLRAGVAANRDVRNWCLVQFLGKNNALEGEVNSISGLTLF